MRIAATMVCLKCLMTPATAVVLLWGFIHNDNGVVVTGLFMVAAAVITVIVQWLYAARTHCPLCMTPVLASKGCARHRHARRVLGSYRLRVALSVLFTGTFRCPYCGEPGVLDVRRRGDH